MSEACIHGLEWDDLETMMQENCDEIDMKLFTLLLSLYHWFRLNGKEDYFSFKESERQAIDGTVVN